MKKKIVVAGAVVVVVGGGYYLNREYKKFQQFDLVFAMKPEEVDLPPKVLQYLTKSALRILPYAGFCEITGCTHEVHANNRLGFEKAMSDHLSKDH